ncbi:hypothetical protein HK105_200161 [Polyrhizophydium stewartii]|uniref:THH1/TOM1/TOM3 domain-containing protein n=1 Tax=Polyrhizophydium stewartii TaxID=2732419 RepID=A0ABR4NKP5_9FUNG
MLFFALFSWINFKSFRDNEWHLGGVRHICLCLVHAAVTTRFIFFCFDPYSATDMISPIATRMSLSSFYVLFNLAYVLMALQWVQICRAALLLRTGDMVQSSFTGAAVVLALYILMQPIIVAAQLRGVRNHFLYLSDSLLMAAVMLVTAPFYLYYGRLFLKRIRGGRGEKERRRRQLRSKVRSLLVVGYVRRRLELTPFQILVMSYGPAIGGLASASMIVLKFVSDRDAPLMFLVVESITHFTDMLSVGFFMYGVMLEPPVR